MLSQSPREMAQFVLIQRRGKGIRKSGPDYSKKEEKQREKKLKPSKGATPKVP